MTLVAKQILAESQEKLAASLEEAVEARQLAGWVRARADAADADAEHQLMVAVPAPSRRRKTHNGTNIGEARVPEMGRDPQVPAESNVLETFGRAPSTPQEEAEDVETKKLPRHDRAYESEQGREHGVIAGDNKRRRHEAEAAASVKLKKKLYYIRTQLRNGKTVWGRALRQEEITSLRAQEAALVKKQNSRPYEHRRSSS